LATAIKRDLASPDQQREVVDMMTALNAGAASVMTSIGVHSATDVTGFGLIGHLSEITATSGVGASLSINAIPVLDGVRELAAQGVVPGGSHRNLAAAGGVADLDAIEEVDRLVITDAQTSGGLLMAVPPARAEVFINSLESRDDVMLAAVIGEVTDGDRIVVT
ncbi:MAG: selenide, water dikinase SelD, partial [Acidimicrobiia bacterium]|nr:selenide, water dikinase SelD [Acidimicrobiia bacterium]